MGLKGGDPFKFDTHISGDKNDSNFNHDKFKVSHMRIMSTDSKEQLQTISPIKPFAPIIKEDKNGKILQRYTGEVKLMW